MPGRRPNILILTTDQQRWDALSYWGTPGYRTPNLDRLAREGANFTRSYCPSPVCTPARVSMITGQYSTRHGAYTIGMSPAPSLDGPTLGSVFSNAGYATAVIGKTHFVARTIEDQHVAGVAHDAECPGSEFWAEHDGPYCGFQFVRHNRRHNADGIPNAHYRVWLERKGAPLSEIDAVHGVGARRPTYGPWDMDPEWTQNAWINDEFSMWLDSQAGDRPWLAMVNYQDPHPPYVCPDPYYSEVDMTNADLGGVVEGEMAGKPGFYQQFIDGKYWTEADGTQYWDGINIPATNVYDRVKDVSAAIRAYIGMTNMVDVYVGRLLDRLREARSFDNTLIVFTSDHGDLLGQHGMWGKGLPAYDDNHRVPGLMMWKAAQSRALGEVTSHFNHVDILPTACDAAGVDVPPGVQGISQVPVLRGETESVRDWALVDHVASRNQTHPELDTVDLHQTTFVFEEWKLVVYAHTEEGELYDLAADPGQVCNLWDREPERRMRMLHRLARAEMERSGTLPVRIASA